jgi:beta-glucosidase-like glycosyl hydrolase
MAIEYKAKGINVILGPTIGPLGRIVTCGRNWEGFSNDPYLSGQLVAETVRATQAGGVITSNKHLVANEVICTDSCGVYRVNTVEIARVLPSPYNQQRRWYCSVCFI